MDKNYSRREFIQKYLYASTLLLGGGAYLASCGSESSNSGSQADGSKDTSAVVVDKGGSSVDPNVTSCTDMTGVSAEELDKRKKLGYVEHTPIADNECSNCNLYAPPKDGAKCGGCMLFKGPVNPDGYCSYYAPPA